MIFKPTYIIDSRGIYDGIIYEPLKVKELRDELYYTCIIEGEHRRPYKVWLHNTNADDEMINISTSYPLPEEINNAWVDRVVACFDGGTTTVHLYTSSIGQDDNGFITIED